MEKETKKKYLSKHLNEFSELMKVQPERHTTQQLFDEKRRQREDNIQKYQQELRDASNTAAPKVLSLNPRRLEALRKLQMKEKELNKLEDKLLGNNREIDRNRDNKFMEPHNDLNDMQKETVNKRIPMTLQFKMSCTGKAQAQNIDLVGNSRPDSGMSNTSENTQVKKLPALKCQPKSKTNYSDSIGKKHADVNISESLGDRELANVTFVNSPSSLATEQVENSEYSKLLTEILKNQTESSTTKLKENVQWTADPSIVPLDYTSCTNFPQDKCSISECFKTKCTLTSDKDQSSIINIGVANRILNTGITEEPVPLDRNYSSELTNKPVNNCASSSEFDTKDLLLVKSHDELIRKTRALQQDFLNLLSKKANETPLNNQENKSDSLIFNNIEPQFESSIITAAFVDYNTTEKQVHSCRASYSDFDKKLEQPVFYSNNFSKTERTTTTAALIDNQSTEKQFDSFNSKVKKNLEAPSITHSTSAEYKRCGSKNVKKKIPNCLKINFKVPDIENEKSNSKHSIDTDCLPLRKPKTKSRGEIISASFERENTNSFQNVSSGCERKNCLTSRKSKTSDFSVARTQLSSWLSVNSSSLPNRNETRVGKRLQSLQSCENH